MSKNDKYKVELHEPNLYAVCVEGKPVEIASRHRDWGYGRSGVITAIPLAFDDPTVAEDVCYLLNQAFVMRMAKDAAEREADRKECKHEWRSMVTQNQNGKVHHQWVECEWCGKEREAVCQHDWQRNLICAKCGADGTKVGKQ